MSVIPAAFAATPGGLYLETHRLRFGVNYLPRKNWWYCWLDWDQQSVVEDLQAIAALGMDHIRVQCLWPFFQPGITNVSARALGNLHALLDAADSTGLDVESYRLQWMDERSVLSAGVGGAAVQARGHSQGNIFTSPEVMEAEKVLLRRIVETVGGHRRFLGFDLGNEMGVLMNAHSNPVTSPAADAWATEMLRVCEDIAPQISYAWGGSFALVQRLRVYAKCFCEHGAGVDCAFVYFF